jgi:hypothetical protein
LFIKGIVFSLKGVFNWLPVVKLDPRSVSFLYSDDVFVALHDILVLDGILCAVDDVVVFAYEKYEAEGCLATYRLAAVEIT